MENTEKKIGFFRSCFRKLFDPEYETRRFAKEFFELAKDAMSKDWILEYKSDGASGQWYYATKAICWGLNQTQNTGSLAAFHMLGEACARMADYDDDFLDIPYVDECGNIHHRDRLIVALESKSTSNLFIDLAKSIRSVRRADKTHNGHDYLLIDSCDWDLDNYDVQNYELVTDLIESPAFFSVRFSSLEFAKKVGLKLFDRPNILIDDDRGRIYSGRDFCTIIREFPGFDFRIWDQPY